MGDVIEPFGVQHLDAVVGDEPLVGERLEAARHRLGSNAQKGGDMALRELSSSSRTTSSSALAGWEGRWSSTSRLRAAAAVVHTTESMSAVTVKRAGRPCSPSRPINARGPRTLASISSPAASMALRASNPCFTKLTSVATSPWRSSTAPAISWRGEKRHDPEATNAQVAHDSTGRANTRGV